MIRKETEIVKIFKRNKPTNSSDYDVWNALMVDFSIAAKIENPKFDTSRFLKACGAEEDFTN